MEMLLDSCNDLIELAILLNFISVHNDLLYSEFIIRGIPILKDFVDRIKP